MTQQNTMRLEFPARSENEGFARVAVGAFAARMDPTIEQLADIRTAVSEAVTNAIVHAYGRGMPGTVVLQASALADRFEVTVQDNGRGIEDVPQAMEPFFTTQPEAERSGMGFTVMQSFMDEVEVRSSPGQGTCVRMVKNISAGE